MPKFKHRLGETFFVSKGRKDKEQLPLIGLHGGPGGNHQVNLHLLKLSSQRKVVIYDQLGSHRSKKTSRQPHSMKLFVEELAYLIDHLKLGAFHLYGLSCGSTLALDYYLATRDKRIASIIFHSPFFSAKVWMADAKRLLAKLPKRQQEVIRLCEKAGATDSQVYKDAQKLYYSRHIYRGKAKAAKKPKRGCGPEIYKYLWGPNEFRPIGKLKSYEKVSQLKKVGVPALVMCGRHDEATPKSCERYAKELPAGSLKVLPGCSHVSLLERPKLTLNEVRGWLDSVES